MDNTADLRALLASRHTLLYVETQEEARFMELLRDAAGSLDAAVWTWSATQGLARDGKDAQYGTVDPRRALDWVAALEAAGVFVFADAHAVMDHPQVLRAIKELAQNELEGRTVVLTAPQRTIPPELEGLAMPWTLRPPSGAELTELVSRTVEDLADRRLAVELDDQHVESIVEAVKGLSMREAERLVQQAAMRDGKLGADDIPYLRRAKAELLAADGILELIESHAGTLADVGGLDGLKEWLRIRREAQDAGMAEAEPPRGLLLTGIPGTGKSFVAKALARTWGLPLVLLDPSRLYRPYIGETEQRLDEALRSVDAMAPAVLWIDEIEKGFASDARSDSGVSQRLLGTFLRWMQERGPGVLLVATANDVSALPPEFLRKGRFDEIFFVDLPDASARAHIFGLHLRRRGYEPAEYDIDALVTTAAGFSGAEIEAAVVGALYRAFSVGRPLAQEDVLDELAGTHPLAETRREEVAALRAWAAERARTA